MKTLYKTAAILVAMQALSGCAEMVLLSGMAMTGSGVADGDAGTAALGAVIMDAGYKQTAGEDYSFGDSLNAGVWAGAAADTGKPELLANAVGGASADFGSAASAKDGFSSVSVGSGSFESGVESPVSANGADCAQLEAESTRQIQAIQRQAEQEVGICQSARLMRKAARIGLKYNNACPIADPTGETRQSLRETIEWANETERAACAGF